MLEMMINFILNRQQPEILKEKETKMNYEKIIEIHESLVNGQRRQMVNQIDEYGLYDFWKDYLEYLYQRYVQETVVFGYFYDAVISYNRIKNR